MAPNKVIYWLIDGPEFGALHGNIYIIEKLLNGLKSASVSFRSFLADILDNIGFLSTHANPDDWRYSAIKGNGESYFKYFLTYVDNLLAISTDPDRITSEIQQYIILKNDTMEEPSNFVGSTIMWKGC